MASACRPPDLTSLLVSYRLSAGFRARPVSKDEAGVGAGDRDDANRIFLRQAGDTLMPAVLGPKSTDGASGRGHHSSWWAFWYSRCPVSDSMPASLTAQMAPEGWRPDCASHPVCVIVKSRQTPICTNQFLETKNRFKVQRGPRILNFGNSTNCNICSGVRSLELPAACELLPVTCSLILYSGAGDSRCLVSSLRPAALTCTALFSHSHSAANLTSCYGGSLLVRRLYLAKHTWI